MNKSKENHNKLERAADRQFVMWAGTLRALPFLERIKVTKAAGFDVLSVTTVDYAKAVAGGLGAKDILSLAADQGIKITHMDPLTRWTPVWEPGGIFDKSVLPFFDCEQDEFFRIAEALRIQSMHVLAMFRPGALSLDRITESYIAVCDRAASLGIHCSLEFIPFMGIPDLATAWNIVKSAGRENSGIIFDFWHFMRGMPDFDLLRKIPGRFIGGVQFADAKLKIPPGVSILQDCFINRAAAGEGEFPINRILQTLDQIGGLMKVGPEIFSSDFDKLTTEEMARLASASTRQTMEAAGVRG